MIEELLEADPGSLQGTEILRDLEGWGSLAVMECMSRVEEKTGILLRPKQIAECQTVQDLFALMISSAQTLP